MPSPSAKRRLGLLALLSLLGAAYLAGLFIFTGSLPKAVLEPDRETDAIVVLTGGSGRIDTAFQLLHEKRARKLFISGVYRGLDMAELLRISHQAPEEVACCVALGYAATDTIGNATETAEWMAREKYRSLRLVTSGYHMPRSLWEFRRAMPGIEIVPHPVFPENVRQDDWWMWPGTASLMMGEYNKYLAAHLRAVFGP